MKKLLTLGDFYVSDFVKPGFDYSDRKKYPLNLVLDDKIGAVKLTEMPPSNQMWGKYWYRSGTNETMKRELKNVVDEICSRIKYKEGDIWLDIACNDGTMFKFVPNNFYKIGIDPADDSYLIESTKIANKVVQDYFNAKNYYSVAKDKAKVITTIAMFYDLEDPHSFIEDIKEVLDDNGVFVIQMSYSALMIQQLAFDNICFKPDTLVMGINKKISEIKNGDMVLDFKGNYTKVINTFKKPYNGNLVKIKSKYIEEIQCTPEHPILIVKKDNIQNKTSQWIDAKDVSIGDYTLVPKIKTQKINPIIDLIKYNNISSPNYRKGLKSITLNEKILWMMGLYVAEGHISGPENNLQINFTLNIKEQSYFNKIKETFEEFGYKTRMTPSKISKAMNIQVSCTSLARVFREWFGKGAKNKKIPDFIFKSEKEISIPFLTGLINGDGNINKNGQMSLHSSSKQLINQVQLMFATLNCMTGLSYVKPYPNFINGKLVKSSDSWQLRGTNKFLSNIFDLNKDNAEEQYLYDDNYIYVEVTDISNEKYNGEVYNIETESNTYVVNNIVVHNCHEHCYYYSLNSLKKLFSQHGMKIVDADLNDVNGGSIRVYFQKNDASEISFATSPLRAVCNYRVEAILEYENRFADITDPKMWAAFSNQIEKLKTQTVDFIKQEKAKGKIIAGYGACHDMTTKLVTETGIKSFGEISVNDKIYSLNTETQEIELSNINEIMKYPYDGELINIYGKRIDQMVTPNHNILFQEEYSNKFKFKTAEEIIKKYSFKLPIGKWTGTINNEKFDINQFVNQKEYSNKCRKIPEIYNTEDFLYLLGVFIGYGYTRNQIEKQSYSINLCIPKEDKARNKLLKTLKNMNLKYREYDNEIQIASKALYFIGLECNRGALNKKIPEWALQYSPKYLKHLLNGLVDSDGWYEKSNRIKFCSSSYRLIKDVIELCFKLGYYPSITKRKKSLICPKIRGREINANESWIVNIASKHPRSYNNKKVKYVGDVWCLSTKNKNFLIERNGKICFSGNSTKGNTLLQLFGLDNTLIDSIAERSPYKYGLTTIGTNIPILSEEDVRAKNPDYFLMLPWPFVKEFVAREHEFLERGGKFIVPCPEFQIIGK